MQRGQIKMIVNDEGLPCRPLPSVPGTHYAIDTGVDNTGNNEVNRLSHLRGGDILALPSKTYLLCDRQNRNNPRSSSLIKSPVRNHASPGRKYIAQNLLLGLAAVRVAFEASAGNPSPAPIRPIASPTSPRFARRRRGPPALRNRNPRIQRRSARWQRGNDWPKTTVYTPDCAGLTFYIVKREITLGRSIEFKNSRNIAKARLEGFPNVAPPGHWPQHTRKPVACFRSRDGLSLQQIATELADVL